MNYVYMKQGGAFFLSSIIFLLFGGVFFFVWTQFTVIQEHIAPAFLGVAFFAIALVSISIFQSFKITESAERMVGSLVKNAILASDDLFIELFRSSPVPYILIDEEGTVSSANRSAIRLFGTTEGALDGEHIFARIEGDNEQHIALFSEKFSQGLFVTDEEVRVRRMDDATRWVLFSLFSFKDSENKRKGLLTLVDISKQKQIDQAKSEFVLFASHQLRTPIAAMKWNMELLLTKYGTTLAPEERAYVDKAVGNLKNMDMLVSDFLNVARFELGTLVVQKETIALAPFLEGIFEEHRARRESKEITITRDDGGVTSLVSDVHLLHMIVGNLLSNALKYTPEKGNVSLRVAHDTHGVTFTIADTGMGIPADEQDRLFTKIFRATNAQAQVPDGTGLGLYIVDQSVKVLGGTIHFVSKENAGTTFTVTLPQ